VVNADERLEVGASVGRGIAVVGQHVFKELASLREPLFLLA
jgi:hypothetical protein